MTVDELAEYIKEHKNGRVPYPYGDQFIISHHTRSVLNQHIHITNEHTLECCAKASNYDEYIELCRPLAKADTDIRDSWLTMNIREKEYRRFSKRNAWDMKRKT